MKGVGSESSASARRRETVAGSPLESPEAAPGTKFCRRCGTTKSIEDFSIDQSRRDGRMVRCKQCDRARNRAAYWARVRGKAEEATG